MDGATITCRGSSAGSDALAIDMTKKRKVLFLCTGNACRSQMAEAILRHLAGDHFDVCSAGSHPAGFIHPLAIETLRQLRIPLANQMSKSWDEFKDTPVDVVITLCDAAAGEACPVWRGEPITAHWPLPDPTHHLGSDEELSEFAQSVTLRLLTKIEGLVNLDWSTGRSDLTRRLEFLGEI